MLTTAPSKSDALLDAALATFDELGYAATPVPAIAARAEVSVGTLYRYFSSKEMLANVLYRREKSRLASCLFSDFDLRAPARSSFSGLWRRLCELAVEDASGLCFLELHCHGAYLDDESRSLARELDLQIAGVLGTWQERGEVRDGDPDLLHAQVFGGFVAVLRHLRQRGDLDVELIEVSTLEPAWGLLEHQGESR